MLSATFLLFQSISIRNTDQQMLIRPVHWDFFAELTDVAHPYTEIHYSHSYVCFFKHMQGNMILFIINEPVLLSNQTYMNNNAEQMCDACAHYGFLNGVINRNVFHFKWNSCCLKSNSTSYFITLFYYLHRRSLL